jgi:hypothetical protein
LTWAVRAFLARLHFYLLLASSPQAARPLLGPLACAPCPSQSSHTVQGMDVDGVMLLCQPRSVYVVARRAVIMLWPLGVTAQRVRRYVSQRFAALLSSSCLVPCGDRYLDDISQLVSHGVLLVPSPAITLWVLRVRHQSNREIVL